MCQVLLRESGEASSFEIGITLGREFDRTTERGGCGEGASLQAGLSPQSSQQH